MPRERARTAPNDLRYGAVDGFNRLTQVKRTKLRSGNRCGGD